MGKRMNQAEFEDRVRKVHGNELDLSEAVYRGAKRYVAVRCTQCGLSFDAFPDNLIRLRTGCPRCNKMGAGSKGYKLYLVSSKEKPFVKIGVTSKELNKRFGTFYSELTVEKVYEIPTKEIALQIEKEILSDYAVEVTGLPNRTEWFHKRNLPAVKARIEELLKGLL